MRKRDCKVICVSVIISGLLSWMILSFYHNSIKPDYRAKPVVSVALKDIIQDFVTVTAKENISDLERQNKVRAFSQRLERELDRVAKKHKIVIISKSAVISGTPDLTPYLVKVLGDKDGD